MRVVKQGGARELPLFLVVWRDNQRVGEIDWVRLSGSDYAAAGTTPSR